MANTISQLCIERSAVSIPLSLIENNITNLERLAIACAAYAAIATNNGPLALTRLIEDLANVTGLDAEKCSQHLIAAFELKTKQGRLLVTLAAPPDKVARRRKREYAESDECNAEWMSQLRKNPQYADLDIAGEFAKCKAWYVSKKAATPGRYQFLSWLDRKLIDAPAPVALCPQCNGKQQTPRQVLDTSNGIAEKVSCNNSFHWPSMA